MEIPGYQKNSRTNNSSKSERTKRIVATIVISVCCIHVSPLKAQFGDNEQLNAAAFMFSDSQFERAIEEFKSIVDTTNLASDDLEMARFYIAFSYYSLQQAETRVWIQKILKENINASPDTVFFTPKYQSQFQFERAQMLGTLQLRTEPPGAKVYIDNVLAGNTPMDTVLVSDTYMLRLEQEGYRLTVQEIPILGARANPVTIELKRDRKRWPWYALGAAALVGGGVILFSREEQALPDLPPPPTIDTGN